MLETEREIVYSVLGFFQAYGWYLLGAGVGFLYLRTWLKPLWQKYEDYKDEAELKKNPDKELARMEAIQRARERMQQRLAEESVRALEAQKEREERKRQENEERLRRYQATPEMGNRLGTDDDNYLPLSGGGASTSSYRAPKRKCPGGGCGR